MNGSWDRILVSKPDGFCVDIRVRGRVREYELPFDESQIENVRPACLSNRILSAVAFGVYEGSLSGVMIVSPVLLILAHFVWRPLSVVAVVICVASICGMYARGVSHFYGRLRPCSASHRSFTEWEYSSCGSRKVDEWRFTSSRKRSPPIPSSFPDYPPQSPASRFGPLFVPKFE